MLQALINVAVASLFCLLLCLSVLAIWLSTRKKPAGIQDKEKPSEPPPGLRREISKYGLDPASILEWEFGYAQATASEAMQDRHTMVNFYLLAVGVITSGVVAILAEGVRVPPITAGGLLWLLCCIGWLYLLKLIRLREAWHHSARAMNAIKGFYIEHARDIAPSELLKAFLWKPDTLPAPHKAFNVFFYSAALIALLNSVAFVGGGALLNLNATLGAPVFVLGCLALEGLGFFAFHIWAYLAFLGRWD